MKRMFLEYSLERRFLTIRIRFMTQSNNVRDIISLLCTIAKKRNQSESLNEALAIITYGYFSILR